MYKNINKQKNGETCREGGIQVTEMWETVAQLIAVNNENGFKVFSVIVGTIHL